MDDLAAFLLGFLDHLESLLFGPLLLFLEQLGFAFEAVGHGGADVGEGLDVERFYIDALALAGLDGAWRAENVVANGAVEVFEIGFKLDGGVHLET